MRIRVRIVSIIVRVFKFFNIYIYIHGSSLGRVWWVRFGSGMYNTHTQPKPITGWISKTQTRPICFTSRVGYPQVGQFLPSLCVGGGVVAG